MPLALSSSLSSSAVAGGGGRSAGGCRRWREVDGRDLYALNISAGVVKNDNQLFNRGGKRSVATSVYFLTIMINRTGSPPAQTNLWRRGEVVRRTRSLHHQYVPINGGGRSAVGYRWSAGRRREVVGGGGSAGYSKMAITYSIDLFF
jgi:hypothetical protein